MSAPRGFVRDFVFPGPTPRPDPDAGIALGQGAMRGTFQAGVVHGFILSGYFPGVIAGTSAGAVTGAALAIAAQQRDEDARLAVAEHHIDLWIQNPAQRLLDRLLAGPFGDLARDLTSVDVTLGHLIGAARREPLAIARVLLALLRGPERLRRGLGAGIEGAITGVVHGLEGAGGFVERLSREALMHGAQEVLTAYGMEHALAPADIIEDHFESLVTTFAPRGRDTTLGDLDRVELVFQCANLHRRTRDRLSAVLDLARDTSPGRPDFSSANLLAAMRASCAFSPLFAGVRARELGMRRLPAGVGPDDLLMDAAIVARDPLSPVIARWARRGGGHEHRAARHRLFSVHLEPLGEIALPPGTSPFIGQALHSLKLRDGLDQRYALDVIDLMTELIDALHRGGEQPPAREGGGRYVAVDTTAIAPQTMLPFGAFSVPEPDDLRRACAAGCRAALEALHGKEIDASPGHDTIPCADLLKKLRGRHRTSFQPLDTLCAACTGLLARPRDPRAPLSPEERERLNDFPAFHEEERAKAKEETPRRLTIAVPAGGVFLGIFQFGAIAALSQYKISPDLYAGASVGTIFSYLLDSSLRRGEAQIPKIVNLAMTVDEWVDGPPQTNTKKNHKSPSPPPEGRIDWVLSQLEGRWESEAVRPLRDLRPAEIAAMLAAPPRGDAQLVWDRFRRGLNALFFTPLPDRLTGEARELDPRYGLDSSEWRQIHDTLSALTRLRLDGVVERLDEIAANLGFFTPGSEQDRGEIIGFEGIAAKMRELVFPDDEAPTLAAHSLARGVRFIFTVTNHTRGRLEHFGYADHHTTSADSPIAVEASLAASSFPLAFRRRSRKEIFGQAGLEGADDLYADGGIFNNFPSDTAMAYLHALTGVEKTRWIGEETHDLYLLSLTSPTTFESVVSEDDGLVWTFARSMGKIDDEKVRMTRRVQDRIRALAERANPILRREGRRQAIKTRMRLISPAYPIYPHAFAFKPYLGFTPDKQREMLASGCRRARLALEWEKDLDHHGDRRRLPLFLDEIRGEAAKVRRWWGSPYPKDSCLFGRFSPSGRGARCPFTGHEEARAIYQSCKETFDRELSAPNMKL